MRIISFDFWVEDACMESEFGMLYLNFFVSP